MRPVLVVVMSSYYVYLEGRKLRVTTILNKRPFWKCIGREKNYCSGIFKKNEIDHSFDL